MRFRGLKYLLCFLGGELVLTDFRCLQEGCFRHAHTGQTPWVSDARMHCNNLITFSLKATERKHAKYDTPSKPFLLIKGHKNWEYIHGADSRQLKINYRTLVRFILTPIWKYISHPLFWLLSIFLFSLCEVCDFYGFHAKTDLNLLLPWKNIKWKFIIIIILANYY